MNIGAAARPTPSAPAGETPAAPPAAAAWHAAEGLRLLALALGVMAATRLALVLGIEVTPSSDSAWYFGRALELIQTGRYAENGVPTAYWPVGYPAFLAGVLAVFGPSVLAGQLANLVLSLACAGVLYAFCVQRFRDARLGGVAALLLAVYPNHMGYSAGLFSEPLFTLQLLLVAVLARPGAGLGRLLAVGVLLGLATLVKAQTQLLGPLLAFVLLLGGFTRPQLLRAAGGALVVTLAMAATIAPWTLRNAEVMGKPVIVSANGGTSLLAGNNPSMRVGMGRNFVDTDPLFDEVRFSVADQVAADERARRAAWNWIRENPGTFVALMPWKAWRLWAYDGETEWIYQAGHAGYAEHRLAFRTVRALNQAYYGLLLVAGVWGMWRLCRWREPHSLAVPFMIVFFTALSMVFSGQSRYHAPLMPFVIAYAAWALLALHRRHAERRR